MSLANNVTLKLAGITKLTEDPEGGTVVKTTGGGILFSPTGLKFNFVIWLSILPYLILCSHLVMKFYLFTFRWRSE